MLQPAPELFAERLDALGVFFVGRVQRFQLFAFDDVQKPFAHHGQLEAQSALASALFGYFVNYPVEAGMTNESPQPRQWPGHPPGRYQPVKGYNGICISRIHPSHEIDRTPDRHHPRHGCPDFRLGRRRLAARFYRGAWMSPTVFREKGYRFFFFSREEPRMHVHIISGDGEAKFWLTPELQLANSYRYNRRSLKEIELLIEAHYDELVSAWRHHFGS